MRYRPRLLKKRSLAALFCSNDSIGKVFASNRVQRTRVFQHVCPTVSVSGQRQKAFGWSQSLLSGHVIGLQCDRWVVWSLNSIPVCGIFLDLCHKWYKLYKHSMQSFQESHLVWIDCLTKKICRTFISRWIWNFFWLGSIQILAFTMLTVSEARHFPSSI